MTQSKVARIDGMSFGLSFKPLVVAEFAAAFA